MGLPLGSVSFREKQLRWEQDGLFNGQSIWLVKVIVALFLCRPLWCPGSRIRDTGPGQFEAGQPEGSDWIPAVPGSPRVRSPHAHWIVQSARGWFFNKQRSFRLLNELFCCYYLLLPPRSIADLDCWFPWLWWIALRSWKRDWVPWRESPPGEVPGRKQKANAGFLRSGFSPPSRVGCSRNESNEVNFCNIASNASDL